MDNHPNLNQNEKAVRLVEYLLRLASLRSKVVRDIADYEKVLWLNDIPKQKGCFMQGWGSNEEYVDIWVEVKNRREPELPSIPDQCKDWVDNNVLRNKDDLPELLQEITRQFENSARQEGSDQPEFINRIERLDDHPEVQKAWDRYVEHHWLPWVEEHNIWERIHKVYSTLFTIHQEQLRLGEEYELVLGLGLLTWQAPSGYRVHRHLIVANVLLEFEARLGKFSIRPNTDGANVRPELDMLDIEEQPTRSEETAKETLKNAEDDPWEKDCIEGVLRAIVHSINPQGEYDDTLATNNVHASTKPIVEYAPAIIFRKRSVRSLTETLKRIEKRIEIGEQIPPEFEDLVEIREIKDTEYNEDSSNLSKEFNGELFFPKPSNEEQRRIVEKLRVASGVLVQGPPGTGKSHTIANLICHLLAMGQKILITAKTPRALKVLEGLVPKEILPLCINLLGSGSEEKRSLKSSVGGILRKNGEWNELLAKSELQHLEKDLRKLREEKSEIERRLRAIREAEAHSHTIADGTYRGTAAQIAKSINKNKSSFDWFSDAIPINRSCPPNLEKVLFDMLYTLRKLTPDKRKELALNFPDTLPSVESFNDLVETEIKAREEERTATQEADSNVADLLSKFNESSIRALMDALSAFRSKCRKLSALPYPWIQEAIKDIISNNSSVWHKLYRVTSDAVASVTDYVTLADSTELSLPETISINILHSDARKLHEHLDSGGKFGWWLFRPKLVKERMYVLKTVRLNGRDCSNIEQIRILANILQVRVEFEKIWGFWVGRCEPAQGPFSLQMQVINSLCEALEGALSLEDTIKEFRHTLQQFDSLMEPLWNEDVQVHCMIESCRLAIASIRKHHASEEIHQIEVPLAALAAKSNAHPVVRESLEAIRNRDMDAFARAFAKNQDLFNEKLSLKKVDENLRRLRQIMPGLADDLADTCTDPCWEKRIQQIREAWHWSQAKTYVEEYLNEEDAPSLALRFNQIEDEIHTTIANIASLRAWKFCFSRLTEDHRRYMKAWQFNMDKITKSGRGKQDHFRRKEAQKNFRKCLEAVPAWVMPLHRVWDTIDPEPGMFDVIIVDEASQCGFEALPLMYLGKKILIVGDDKQISPEAEGIELIPVTKLINQFLFDFEHKALFNINSSLFDHGALRYSSRCIVLREHFRCMPEIIRFSNELCYRDTPLIPLRQYGKDRLEPPLEHIFVKGGYREGSNSRAINRPEADAIVAKIVELCNDPKYAGKTMGVAVLQGYAQAGLIEGALLNLLGAEEMEKRRIVCGNPYSFQGDERDIMFLSMVAAPNERIGSLAKAADERRFNVAASRARDQMWLFHSVSREDLSTSDMRRKLLEFFENTKPPQIAGIEKDELERRATQDDRKVKNSQPPPFDSWFEVDVALELVRKGFSVIPQFEVAGKYIDLVIVGGFARLAVECDGDECHGAEQYEADMQRQRMLERCGWKFFRVRESAFYSNKEAAMRKLWPLLEERGIMPY